MEEQKIDKLIEQAIQRVGKEKDEHDRLVLRSFLRRREHIINMLKNGDACASIISDEDSGYKVATNTQLRRASNQASHKKYSLKFKSIWLSIASIAAIIAIVFSLNIYRDNLRMDEAFRTHYTPLEYDPQLMSRGEESPLSLELAEAMDAYQRQDYSAALQKLNAIPNLDVNFLIYKAICLIETDQLPQAIHLLEELVSHGEATEYYQQANWYLALAYLKEHEGENAKMVIEKMKEFSIYIELDKLLNQ